MIEYDENWLLPLIFRWNGSVYYRAAWFAIPGCAINVVMLTIDPYLPSFRDDAGIFDLHQSVIWGATTAVLLTMLGFRTRMGYSRFWEGTGLLHQMKGEWFDTISNCVTFSISAKLKNPEKVIKFRHTIVRLMSLCHASALEEISGMDSELETIDTRGLDYSTLLHLKNCVEVHGFNKVEVLLHLIQSLITKAHEEGVLSVPPPILSRVFQTCSRGYVNLLNTKKITDTKFPFPYVQLITLLLLLHTVFVPMVVSALVQSNVMALIITFMALFGMHAINFIAIELEDPFGTDDNDLPLEHFQTEMNSCLLMLLHYDTDIIASTSPSCVFDFAKLKKSMQLTHDGPHHDTLLSRVRSTWMGSETSESDRPDRSDRVGRHGSDHESVESRKTSRRLSDVVCSETMAMGFQPLGAVPGRTSISDADIMQKEIEAELQQHQLPELGALSPCSSEAPEKSETVPPELPGLRDSGCLCRGECTCKARAIPITPEPKLVTTQDLSPFLIDSMDEFNRNLQAWTQQMEDQVRDLSESFVALNKLSNAAPSNHAIGLVRPVPPGRDPYEPIPPPPDTGQSLTDVQRHQLEGSKCTTASFRTRIGASRGPSTSSTSSTAPAAGSPLAGL
mmetsp:Transcript_42242/g.106409  ORF Transcript_42242/g.106409 Transcript_42242/m.106409 type:complete len:619 (-) Transcript_42242:750-2606(-)